MRQSLLFCLLDTPPQGSPSDSEVIPKGTSDSEVIPKGTSDSEVIPKGTSDSEVIPKGIGNPERDERSEVILKNLMYICKNATIECYIL